MFLPQRKINHFPSDLPVTLKERKREIRNSMDDIY
jgi:hypothetical protein